MMSINEVFGSSNANVGNGNRHHRRRRRLIHQSRQSHRGAVAVVQHSSLLLLLLSVTIMLGMIMLSSSTIVSAAATSEEYNIASIQTNALHDDSMHRKQFQRVILADNDEGDEEDMEETDNEADVSDEPNPAMEEPNDVDVEGIDNDTDEDDTDNNNNDKTTTDDDEWQDEKITQQPPTLIDDGNMHVEEEEAVVTTMGADQEEEEKVDDDEEAASDSSATAMEEKTNVQKTAAEELLKDAESDMSRLRNDDSDQEAEEYDGQNNYQSPSTKSAKDDASSSAATSSTTTTYYPNKHRSAWIAHGAIATTVFGLLIPSSITSAFFRDYIPSYWIYIHVCINVLSFALTFFTVGIAITTMNGMGNAGEGHMKELHHIVGLLLLLLVSFQTANGFLRPPREFNVNNITGDVEQHDSRRVTPMAIIRSVLGEKRSSLTARTLWYLVHGTCGLVLVFGLGTYQVQSGLSLFAKRFEGTPDWGQVYLGYVAWLVTIILIAKVYLTCCKGKMEGRGGNNGHNNSGLMYDPENDLTVAQFETV